MKLQKLTIHNIASIEDAVIDFDAEPLANSEVFLIRVKPEQANQLFLTQSAWHCMQTLLAFTTRKCKGQLMMQTKR